MKVMERTSLPRQGVETEERNSLGQSPEHLPSEGWGLLKEIGVGVGTARKLEEYCS